jgi:hypothetical protein
LYVQRANLIERRQFKADVCAAIQPDGIR